VPRFASPRFASPRFALSCLALSRLALPLALAVAGVATVGLVAGDPRAARTSAGSERIILAVAALAVTVGVLAWRAARRPAWWLPPALVLVLVGTLAGWITGVACTGRHFEHVAHLGNAPGEALLVAATTAAGMALPPAIYAALLMVKPRGRA